MIWLFSFYFIGVLIIFSLFVYYDIQYEKELGAFNGFSYLMLAMSWPFLGLMLLGNELESWYFRKKFEE